MPIPYDRNASLVSHHPSLTREHDVPGPPTQAAVEDGQRARILEAMVQTVAAQGYPRTTVADVVRAAGVSRSTFYAVAGGKEECFLEAHRLGTEVLEDHIDTAMALAGAGWRGRLQDGIRAYLRILEDDRVFARTFLVEIHQGSPATALARDAVLDRFAARFAASHAAAVRAEEGEGEPSRDVFVILAHGIDALVARALRTGEPESLPELEPVVLDAALRMIRGA